jgi:HPt (histidine-containing phosphotransfer) domain-containing protein
VADSIDDEVRAIWERMKPTAVARAQALRDAFTAPGGDDAAARADAHKLAGSLGMYGLTEAAELATAIDGLIVAGALDDHRRDELRSLAEQLCGAVEAER